MRDEATSGVRRRVLTVIAAATTAAVLSPTAVAQTMPDAQTAPALPRGGATATAAGSRALLSDSVDSPTPPNCSTDRYEAPDPQTLPSDLDPDGYKLTSRRDDRWRRSVRRMCGSLGPGVDLAWGVTRGRPDVLIAVLDSGVKWTNGSAEELGDMADRAYLNVAELPKPQGSASYDANGDGRVTASDYGKDRRVGDRNRNGMIDPHDLILTPAFNDGTDADRNGHVDDISGWDFLFGDNDPNDDVAYGHGTGEARDSTAAADNGGDVGTCPSCTFLPVRVSDSFIAEGGRFAAGVLFALDSGAAVIQEALGALNNPPQAQAAIDAAYERGVPVMASMADEASKHPNLPAALNHTIPVNSMTRTYGILGDVGDLLDNDAFSMNGCTNYGGLMWVTVPSDGCSSEATGLVSGMVGLVVAAARDANVSPPLSANEIAQLLRGTADDVDFSTPRGREPANEAGQPGFARYPTTPGWDATFGFGRVNAYEAVRAAAAGEIPPEADIVGPAWFEVLPVDGTVAITGSVAARRSSGYRYRVEWATGLQPPPWPATDTWHVVGSGDGRTAPLSGTLATVDLAEVAAALPDAGRGPSSTGRGSPDEDRFTVRVRVVVTDAEGRIGVNQRQLFVHDDPDLIGSSARLVPGAGAASPAFGDLDGDGRDELIVATDDGYVHAFGADGSEPHGWPVRTQAAPWWPTRSRIAVGEKIPPAHNSIGVGAPVVADLDGDGRLDVATTDGGGSVTVWDATGRERFRASVDPRLSQQRSTDSRNRLKRGFLAQVAAGDLDGDGVDELVAAAMDRHVYAWHLDGAPVRGFPVLVVDPATVEAVDRDSRQVTFGVEAEQGGELVVTPAVGDLDGDGKDEIVVGAQEAYPEPVKVFPPVGLPGVSGTTRLYAIWGDGTAHRGSPDRSKAHPSDHAYMPGWPVSLAMIKTAVLPTVGDGVNTQAAIGDVDGDGRPEVVAASAAGPVQVFEVSGRTNYELFGQPAALAWLGSNFGNRATSRDAGVVAAAFGGPSLGNLAGDSTVEVAAPTVGLGQALDVLLPGKQEGDTQLMAWDGRSGQALGGFPHRTSDLAFFVSPAIADVDGDGDHDVVAGNGVSLLDAVDAAGNDAPGFPKLMGGWTVGTPALGDLDGDGVAEMALTRRDGRLFIWRTKARAETLTEWIRFGHDGRNSGDARTPHGD
ncbi:MAG: VCBS repeat-containing protein [Microthrixaceae bacterium]|nr:VCBS repeat-containing protein [Microthrixaceae bacterium]